jgi:hypothetical protein
MCEFNNASEPCSNYKGSDECQKDHPKVTRLERQRIEQERKKLNRIKKLVEEGKSSDKIFSSWLVAHPPSRETITVRKPSTNLSSADPACKVPLNVPFTHEYVLSSHITTSSSISVPAANRPLLAKVMPSTNILWQGISDNQLDTNELTANSDNEINLTTWHVGSDPLASTLTQVPTRHPTHTPTQVPINDRLYTQFTTDCNNQMNDLATWIDIRQDISEAGAIFDVNDTPDQRNPDSTILTLNDVEYNDMLTLDTPLNVPDAIHREYPAIYITTDYEWECRDGRYH